MSKRLDRGDWIAICGTVAGLCIIIAAFLVQPIGRRTVLVEIYGAEGQVRVVESTMLKVYRDAQAGMRLTVVGVK